MDCLGLPLRWPGNSKPRRQDLKGALESRRKSIQKICDISGVAGASVTVLHQGAPIFGGNFGYRDLSRREPVDADTIFPIASLTMSFTASCIHRLRAQGHLTLDDLVESHLPEARTRKPIAAAGVTIADLLGHRTGRQKADSLWLGSDGELLLDKRQTPRLFAQLQPLTSLRTRFGYNNICYSLLGDIIERRTLKPYHVYLKETFLDPLGMERTIVTKDGGMPPNTSLAYSTLANGEPYNVPAPGSSADAALGSAGGLLSTANDLIKYYGALMKSWHRKATPDDDRGDPMFDQVPWLFTPLQIMQTPSFREKTYASGWVRSQLPATVGDIGVNPGLVDEMPILADGVPSQLALWHQGSLVGATCFVMLFPETESAVLVLTNTTALNDAADWIGQMLVETLLDSPKRQDYVALALASARRAIDKFSELSYSIDQMRSHEGPSRDLCDYVGTYVGLNGDFRIRIRQSEGALEVLLQERESQKFSLRHHHDDVFTWFSPWDAQTQRARWISFDRAGYMIRFIGDAEGNGSGRLRNKVDTSARFHNTASPLVRSVYLSPEVGLLVTGCDDGAVRLWEPDTIGCLRGHHGKVNSAVLSTDGRTIASASDDRTVRLWNTISHKCFNILVGHQDKVNSAVFLRDSRTLASASDDATIRIWNVETGQCETKIGRYGGPINSVTFSHHLNKLISASYDTVRMWNIETEACETQFTHLNKALVSAVAVSDDFKTLASAFHDNLVWIWDIQTEECRHILRGHDGPVTAVAFLSDPKTMISASHDNTLRLRDVLTGAGLGILRGHRGMVNSVAVSLHSNLLASASVDETVRLWDLTTATWMGMFAPRKQAQVRQPPNNHIYALGRIYRHNVVIATQAAHGSVFAGSFAQDLANTFTNLRVCLVIGTGGGAPTLSDDTRLGDIVVGRIHNGTQDLVRYDLDKAIQGEKISFYNIDSTPPTILRVATTALRSRFRQKGYELNQMVEKVLEIHPELKAKYSRPPDASDRLYKSDIACVHPNSSDGCAFVCGSDSECLVRRATRGKGDNPKVHHGLIASATRVLRDAELRDRLAARLRILCFETGLAGLPSNFPALVIRSISNYSDSHNSPEWDGFAAMMAAAYAKDILLHISANELELEQRLLDGFDKP